jgi:HK97 family phage prohead protease
MAMEMHTRRFPVSLDMGDFDTEGDGRTVVGRIVPYGETIRFVDPYDGNQVKQERFVRGAFAKQAGSSAWARVLLTYEHDDGFTNILGYGRDLEERDDGAYATFRLYEADAAKARDMIEHSHRGLSVAFSTRKRGRTDPDGVVVRDDVRAERVGITNDPAYSGAKVLAVRNQDGLTVPVPVLLAPDDPPEQVPTPYLDTVRAQLDELRRGPR